VFIVRSDNTMIDTRLIRIDTNPGGVNMRADNRWHQISSAERTKAYWAQMRRIRDELVQQESGDRYEGE
jgi:hypothetical protein